MPNHIASFRAEINIHGFPSANHYTATLLVAISKLGPFTSWNRALGFHFEDGRYSKQSK